MFKRNRRVIIGVMGGADPATKKAILDQAEETGRLIARAGAVLLCGGRSGIMEAAARGARSEISGETLAVLPGPDTEAANPYMDLVVATGMGNGRNIINILSSDAVIAFPGGPGTLSEMALALKCGVPLVNFGAWDLEAAAGRPLPQGYTCASTPAEAVELALRATSIEGPEERRARVLELIEERNLAMSRGDMDELRRCYVHGLPREIRVMKTEEESLSLTLLSGGDLIADYRCLGEDGSTWVCSTVLVPGESGYKIISDHWSQGSGLG